MTFQNILKCSFFIGFLLHAFIVIGDNNIPPSEQKSGFEWENISQEQFFENLVLCQVKLSEYKWSKTTWPKENNNPKPTFSEIADSSSFIQQVEESVTKQNLLESYFNLTITSNLLQDDLNRMAENTKDPNELKVLFSLFDNNPVTVALCVSRPYLVNNIFNKSYYWNNEIHKETYQLAQNELSAYKADDPIYQTHSTIHSSTYKLVESGDEKLISESDENKNFIYVNIQEYQRIINEASSQNLVETELSYEYKNIIKQTENTLELNTHVWHKTTSSEWINSQAINFQFSELGIIELELPKINSSKNTFNKYSATNSTDSWKVHNKNSPEDRMDHSAVWTGTEMIVWGGYHGSDNRLINTGGRYNPTTDTWIQTSTDGAPIGRLDYSAIWTGDEMIIWGGSDSEGNMLNNGGRYNPLSDIWTTTSTVDAPTSRINHAALWVNDKMLISGGTSTDELDNDIILETGAIYSPDINSWSDISLLDAPPKRKNFGYIWSGSEMIVWGGYGDNGFVLNSGGRYNPETNQWIPTENVNTPSARSSPSVVWSGSEMIVWGGFVPFSPGGTSGSAVDTGARYNPINDSWIDTSTIQTPPASSGSDAIWTGTEMIVWNTNYSTGGIYDPDSDTWRTISQNPLGERPRSSVIWTGSEMIAWGGYSELNLSTGFKTTNDGVKYNPLNDTWIETNLTNAPTGRSNHTAIWTGAEMIVWGGEWFADSSIGGRYDPITDTWTQISSGTRIRHSMIWTGTEVIVWGGQIEFFELNSGWRYNPILNSWTLMSTSDAPTPRTRHTAVWTGTEMIIWGGDDDDNFGLNTGGSYDLKSDTWSPTSNVNAPSARYSHTAVWTGSEMIVWGGLGNNMNNIGRRYNPFNDTWIATTGVGAPVSRYLHETIWNGDEMIVWGGDNGNKLNSGSRYSPISDSWTAINLIDAPSARTYHTMVLADQELIIWGGFDDTDAVNSGGRYNLDSESWVATDIVTAPAGRGRHRAVWTGKEMLVWGGSGIGTGYSPYIETYYPYNNEVIDLIYSNGFESE